MRRFPSITMVLLLVLASFTFVAPPATAALPPPVADAGADQTVGEGDEDFRDRMPSTPVAIEVTVVNVETKMISRVALTEKTFNLNPSRSAVFLSFCHYRDGVVFTELQEVE